MINALLITAMLSCPQVKCQNFTTQPWTVDDIKIFKQWHRKCRIKYPEAPCLTLFRKSSMQSHSILCGTGNDEPWPDIGPFTKCPVLKK